MSNPIKYSTGSESLALKKGNFYIGTGDVGKGPTSTTGYYNGITPPSGGYTIYLNKATGGPSIYTCANDTELISLTNSIAGTSYTTANECLTYFAGQSDKMVLNRDYEGIVTDGLVYLMDGGFTTSYPKNGTTIYDNSIYTNNGTLVNGVGFSSDSGGCLTFDGTNDLINLESHASNFSNYLVGSIFVWFKVESTEGGGTLLSFSEGSDPKVISINNSRRYINKPVIIDDDDGGSSDWNLGAYESVGGGGKYRDGNWHNVCLVVGSNFNKLYMDGSELTLTYGRGSSGTGNWLFPNNLQGFNIGVSDHPPNRNTQRYFNGKIGNVYIYNRPLTSSEVLQNFNAQKGRFGL